jgi:hypothetical protein
MTTAPAYILFSLNVLVLVFSVLFRTFLLTTAGSKFKIQFHLFYSNQTEVYQGVNV